MGWPECCHQLLPIQALPLRIRKQGEKHGWADSQSLRTEGNNKETDMGKPYPSHSSSKDATPNPHLTHRGGCLLWLQLAIDSFLPRYSGSYKRKTETSSLVRCSIRWQTQYMWPPPSSPFSLCWDMSGNREDICKWCCFFHPLGSPLSSYLESERGIARDKTNRGALKMFIHFWWFTMKASASPYSKVTVFLETNSC